jgi:hypothetical protein
LVSHTEDRLKVSENKALRRISGSRRQEASNKTLKRTA